MMTTKMKRMANTKPPATCSPIKRSSCTLLHGSRHAFHARIPALTLTKLAAQMACLEEVLSAEHV